MNISRRLIARLKALLAGTRVERDMDRELQAHIEMIAEEYQNAGLSPHDAERAARRRFGNVSNLKERGRDVRGAGLAGRIGRDLRYAIRRFQWEPGFTAAVVLILGLGIGTNTAIFSVVDQVLLHDLPYPEAEELVEIYEVMPARDIDSASVSPANLVDWRAETRRFESFAAWNDTTATLTGAGDPITLAGQDVSAEFFPLLGIEPVVGRVFTAEEDQPNPPAVVVLSHRLWQQRFGSDPAIVGRAIELDTIPHTVLGVMPSGFRYLSMLHPTVDYWTPAGIDFSLAWRDMGVRILNVVARIADGATVEEAETELAGIAERLAATYESNEDTTVRLAPLREEMFGEIRTSVLVLFGAVTGLLLIACFNVAGLLLARGARRRHEIALRTSFGASRGAIVGQLLTEHLLLGLAGGLAGVLIAYGALTQFGRLIPESLSQISGMGVDGRALLYAAAVSLITGLLAGVAPAISAGSGSLASGLASATRSFTARTRLREGLVIAQVAVTLVLVFGSGLLARSLNQLLGDENGLESENILSFQVMLPEARYDAGGRVRFFEGLIESLESLPGVTSAGASMSLPITGGSIGTAFHVQGTPVLPMAERPLTQAQIVTPGYFRTLGIPLQAGRTFSSEDQRETAPMRFVVNEAFARTYFPDGDALQYSVSVVMGAENPYGRIVGIVGDVKNDSLWSSAVPTLFYNNSHFGSFNIPMTLYVRAEQTTGLESSAVQTLRGLDPAVPVNDMAWLDDILAGSVARERLNAVVTTAFALTALLLASFGLYGLLAFLVAERTREIGIRMALGARAQVILTLILGRGLRMGAIGLGLGAAVAILTARLLGNVFSSLLYGVTVYDPATFAGTVILLLAVVGVAVLVPARRATRVDPLTALREE